MDTNTVVPSKEEFRQIRRHYSKIGLIVIVLVVVFSGVNTLVAKISGAVIGGGFDKEHIEQGVQIIRAYPIMSAIYSYFFPLAADVAALLTGLAVTKLDLRKMLTRKGFDGKDMLNITAFSMGLPIVASVVVLIITSIVAMAAGVDPNEASSAMSSVFKMEGPLWLNILIYLYICLIGPIMEELIFRGVILEGLRKYGNTFAVIMSALLFGLMHQRFAQCLPAVVIGVVFAVYVVRTGSLLPGIFVHIVNNTLSAIAMVMMNGFDSDAMMKMAEKNDIDGMMKMMQSFMPLMIFLVIYMVIRLASFVYTIIKGSSVISGKKKLFEQNDYCAARGWKPFFASVPCLLIVLFLTVTTFMSII